MKRCLAWLLFLALCLAPLLLPCAAEDAAIPENTDYVNGDWHADTPENHGMDPAKLEAFYDTIRDEPVLSVLLVKDGSIISQYAKEGYLPDGMFSLNSCTKSVTGTLVGVAIDQGLIAGVDAKLADYFPGVAQDADMSKRDITLVDRQALI